ncbi:MAG: FAD-dependent oxidoreductase [Lentisphaerota bacterium]
MTEKLQKFRCIVCGYVHIAAEAPKTCPVCGSSKSDFELYAEKKQESAPAKITKWRCINCSYVHNGDNPPDICPVCAAEKDKFEAFTETNQASGVKSAKVVIVGGGIAGVTAAETMRKFSPDSIITLITMECDAPYYRLNLTRFLGGDINREDLIVHPLSWYQENNIELVNNAIVYTIDKEKKVIALVDGREFVYDKLILATGSHPFIPQYKGTELEGVYSLRTVSDADEILAKAVKGARCVCIGGGILGIETAGSLAKRAVNVTMLESHGWLMPRQLNLKAAAILEKHLLSLDIKTLKETKVQEISGDKKVSGVLLQNGTLLEADIVILATGVRANTVLARKAGLEFNNGIIVNNHLMTSSPDIFAAGDATEHNGQLYGTWAPAQYQGSIAALNALGIPTVFGGIPRSNTVKALGLDITSIGQFMPEDGSYTVIEKEDEKSYIEFVFHDSKMVGTILIGHAKLATAAKKAIDSNTDFSELLITPKCDEIISKFHHF